MDAPPTPSDDSPAVPLPGPEGERPLQTIAATLERLAVKGRPPDLLSAHEIGAAFNFILDQRGKRLPGAASGDAPDLLQKLGGAGRGWSAAALYRYGRIARHLERSWIEEAGARVGVDVAAAIVRPRTRGEQQPLPPPLLRCLLRGAAETAISAPALSRIQAAIGARLRASPATPTDEALTWIDAAFRDCLERRAAGPSRRAATPGPSQPAATVDLDEMIARLQEAGQALGHLPRLLCALDPEDEAVRQKLRHLELCAGDLVGRLQGVLGRFTGGERRRQRRDAPAAEREGEAPGQEELEQDPAGLEQGLQAMEPASSSPAARPSAPAPDCSGEPPCDEGRGEDREQAQEELEQGAGGVQVPAPPPLRRTPLQEHVTVPYPGRDPDPSPAERHACALIALVAPLGAAADEVIARGSRGDLVSARLALLGYRQSRGLLREIAELRPALQEGAAAGERLLGELEQKAPGACRASLLPVPTEAGAQFVPLAHVAYEVVDPIGDPDATDAERALWRVLGLLGCARGQLAALSDRLLLHRDEADDLLVLQLREALFELAFLGNRLVSALQLAVGDLQRAEAEAEEAEAGLLLLRAQAEASLLVLGAGRVPEQHATIGILPDGRPVGLATGRGLSLVALGGTGRGKSHLGVLLAESFLLPLPGLNRLGRPGVPIVFAADWRKGFTRHQHLCALDPNPRREEWQWLQRHLHIALAPQRCAFPRLLALCLPGRRRHYEEAYPDLLERGLEVRELRLHPEEWGSFGYGAMLSALYPDRARPQWAGRLLDIVGSLGDGASPGRVWRALGEAGLPGRGAAVRGMLDRMAQLTSEGERIADILHEGALCVLLLEDEFLGPEVILPLQASVMNALSRGAPPDLPLLLLVEEVGKQGMSAEVQGLLEQMVREARHGLVSLFLGAHLASDLPAATVTLATGVAQFGGTSAIDLRRLGELRPEFLGTPARLLLDQPRGVATLGFAECSDAALAGRAQQVFLRPSCVHAGGETREAG